ncbi:hypothetical protein RFI_37577, partial [Reticulomyxa filosa]
MKEQTFEELFCQNYYCLEWKDIKKIRNENVRFELVNMENNIIESDKDVKRKFKKIKPSFKIIWTSFQPIIIGKTKTIKNALVMVIAIKTFYFLISTFLHCKIVLLIIVMQRYLQNMIFIFHSKMFLIYTLSKEEEIQKIIHHWIRTLNIQLGWIKDFDKFVVNYESNVFMFDTFRSSSKLINTFNGHTKAVWSIDYSTFDDCQFICSGSQDKTVCVWN